MGHGSIDDDGVAHDAGLSRIARAGVKDMMIADTVLDEVAFIVAGRRQGLVFNGDDAQEILVIVRSGMFDPQDLRKAPH